MAQKEQPPFTPDEVEKHEFGARNLNFFDPKRILSAREENGLLDRGETVLKGRKTTDNFKIGQNMQARSEDAKYNFLVRITAITPSEGGTFDLDVDLVSKTENK